MNIAKNYFYRVSGTYLFTEVNSYYQPLHDDNLFFYLVMFIRARELDPLHPETLFNLGIVYANLRQYCSSFIACKAMTKMARGKSFEQELKVFTDECFKQLK